MRSLGAAVVKMNMKTGCGHRCLVTGRATTVGTKYFLDSSEIQLQHHLKQSNLYINPVLIGNPFTLQDGQDDNLDNLYYGAVMEDRSNCIYVYSNNDAGTWHSKTVGKLVETGLDREGLVTVANLGTVTTREEVLHRLEEATKLTDQECIDVAMLNVRDHCLCHCHCYCHCYCYYNYYCHCLQKLVYLIR
jgi:hypothetical protein